MAISESAKETREGLEKKKKRLEDDVDKYRKRVHDLEKTLKVKLSYIHMLFISELSRRHGVCEDGSSGMQEVWRKNHASR